jgi:hypothetical protein
MDCGIPVDLSHQSDFEAVHAFLLKLGDSVGKIAVPIAIVDLPKSFA